jgi:hypothetical protein
MRHATARIENSKSVATVAGTVTRASLRLGWNVAEQPRSFRSFLDLACRYWLEVRRDLGISRGDRSAQDTRDVHLFIGAAASAYAAAPLSCADLQGNDREECLAVAGFARLMANEVAVAALLGRHAATAGSLPAAAVAAFQNGYAAAISLSR